MSKTDKKADPSLLELIEAYRAGQGGIEQIRAKMSKKKVRFPEIYRALGELAVEATLLESELTMILCQLIVAITKEPKSVNADFVNAIAQERRSFPQLADFVRKIFDAHIKDQETREPFHNMLKEAKALMKSRGEHIHGHWNLDYTTDKVAHLAHKAVHQSVDPEDIQTVVNKIKDCRLRIYPTLTKIFRAHEPTPFPLSDDVIKYGSSP